VVIGGYVEYNVLDGQDEKIRSRVLFTGPGINSGVYRLSSNSKSDEKEDELGF